MRKSLKETMQSMRIVEVISDASTTIINLISKSIYLSIGCKIKRDRQGAFTFRGHFTAEKCWSSEGCIIKFTDATL